MHKATVGFEVSLYKPVNLKQSVIDLGQHMASQTRERSRSRRERHPLTCCRPHNEILRRSICVGSCSIPLVLSA